MKNNYVAHTKRFEINGKRYVAHVKEYCKWNEDPVYVTVDIEKLNKGLLYSNEYLSKKSNADRLKECYLDAVENFLILYHGRVSENLHKAKDRFSFGLNKDIQPIHGDGHDVTVSTEIAPNTFRTVVTSDHKKEKALAAIDEEFKQYRKKIEERLDSII